MPAVTESKLDPDQASYSETILAGDHWMREIPAGATLRIVDLEGNQAADTLFFNAADPADRYCPAATIRRSGNVYLRAGTGLYSLDGTLLLTITADTCGRHDTVGGACSRESNTMRYAHDKESMHACRDSFLAEAATSAAVPTEFESAAPARTSKWAPPVPTSGASCRKRFPTARSYIANGRKTRGGTASRAPSASCSALISRWNCHRMFGT